MTVALIVPSGISATVIDLRYVGEIASAGDGVLGWLRMPLARQESLRFILPLLVVAALLVVGVVMWPAGRAATVLLLVLELGLTAFVLYFFRDPEREVPADPTIIVAAADGRVVGVEEMEEPDFQLGRRLRIAIFLSVFDVHINRSPVEGRVKKTTYKAGQFLDVRHVDASTRNEALAWLLETARGPIAVRQIAGLVARRIVPWAKEGSALARGQRFGMIRFGSRTEIFLPVGCTPLVKPGDRVQGAATPIARWPRE
jgi:phosphatidylserine decarboxylase